MALVMAGCGSSSPDGRPTGGAAAGPAGSAAIGTVPAGARTRPDGFGEVSVTVTDGEGRSRTLCLLLADTAGAQERGLMFVTDPALGGYDGMLFAFEHDQEGGFWMRNTRLPLSIAWLRADGTTVSTRDMTPCPDTQADCPTYPPGGAYRYVVEVPRGRLDDLGLADRSRVSVGARTCA
jgi:uncharacterized protein